MNIPKFLPFGFIFMNNKVKIGSEKDNTPWIIPPIQPDIHTTPDVGKFNRELQNNIKVIDITVNIFDWILFKFMITLSWLFNKKR